MNTTLELSEIRERIGQLFMSGIPGPRVDEATVSLIRDYHLGGVILFARNIQDPIQLGGLCHDLQNAAMAHNGPPLFIAIDQEGGRVARLREPFSRFPGNTAIGCADDPVAAAMEFGRITAMEMRIVGLNMNLAPVVDVRRGEPEMHLEGRMFGDNPEVVSLLGRTVVRSLQANGVMAVAKHFPGLGHAMKDPHLELPRIEAGRREIEEVDLPPFHAAIGEGVAGIMSSHAVYTALDPGRPATLSPAILTGLLREGLGFQGLTITDDLEMGAIAKHWGVVRSTASAFAAGADILLICRDQGAVLEGMGLITDRLLKGEIPYERVRKSYMRVSKSKESFLMEMEKVSFVKIRDYFKV